MGSEVKPHHPFASHRCHFLAIDLGHGTLVDTPEPQSPPLQSGFAGRLEQRNIYKAFRTEPGAEQARTT